MDIIEITSIMIRKAPFRTFAFVALSLVTWCGVPLMSAYWREWGVEREAWYQTFFVTFPIVMVLFISLGFTVYRYKNNQRGENQ